MSPEPETTSPGITLDRAGGRTQAHVVQPRLLAPLPGAPALVLDSQRRFAAAGRRLGRLVPAGLVHGQVAGAIHGGTIDANDLGGTQIEGQEWVFEDINLATGQSRTNRTVRCRAVRNSSGIALLPKRLARFEADGAEYGARVDGYTATTGERGYPVDEYLAAAGVPANDVFWIVIEGPAMVITDLAAAAGNVIVGL